MKRRPSSTHNAETQHEAENFIRGEQRKMLTKLSEDEAIAEKKLLDSVARNDEQQKPQPR